MRPFKSTAKAINHFKVSGRERVLLIYVSLRRASLYVNHEKEMRAKVDTAQKHARAYVITIGVKHESRQTSKDASDTLDNILTIYRYHCRDIFSKF